MTDVVPSSPWKKDFPALRSKVNGRDVAYLDSASSAQKPYAVIDAMAGLMSTHYANVHRGVYDFASKTSAAYESARGKVAGFLNAATDKEIVFTRNTTEAINLVAATWGQGLKPGDEVILTALEHHANIVPWVRLKKERGIVIRVVPIDVSGALDMAAFKSFLSAKTKLVSVIHMSNALGTVNDVAEICRLARASGAVTLVDGSQAAAHLPVDVQKIGCDFYVFTGHKLYGPSGIGVLYGRADVLRDMPPYQGGGEMIEAVSFDDVTFKDPPYRFEAGTPAIVEVIGLGAAIDYFKAAGIEKIHRHEQELLHAAEKRIAALPGVKIFSKAPQRAATVSFTLAGVHPHDAATIFDQMGLCVRAGHHCAQPLMKVLGVPATIRASFAMYNDMNDVERLAEGITRVQKMFGVAA
jgi:cysteine desulfurase/selenocysteine lyase